MQRHNHPDDPLHIATCVECQHRERGNALDVDLERVWHGVTAEVWAEPVSRLERVAARVLRSPGLARAIATTPSLVLSWILASVAVYGVGIVATAASSTNTPWVALLAPAIAGAGIAYAYGPGVDPAYELVQTMAIPDRMILLVRVLAVFGVNALLGLGASLVSAQAAGLTLGWLLPMTTVSAFGLAVATLVRSANVGVAAALAGWCLVVLASAYDSRDFATAVDRGELIPLYVIGTAICSGLALYAMSGSRSRGLQWQ